MQDEIIPHLEPGRLPSTVDPDAIQLPDKGKISHRPVRISAWKLAKLDSNEAMKAATKARASSSVLRPVASRHQAYDADYVSTSSISGRSSPISTTDQGFQNKNAKAGPSRLSPSRSSYPPSRASREDIEASHHSVSSFSSPRVSNITPSPLEQRNSNRDHYNPIYQSSTDQSQCSAKLTKGNENVAQIPLRKNNFSAAENTRSSVFWDQEAGRFVSSSSRAVGSSSQVPGAELLYTGQSIFFGGPVVNEQPVRGTRNSSSSLTSVLDRGSTYQQGRAQSGGQLPVFTPSDHQQNRFPSRFS